MLTLATMLLALTCLLGPPTVETPAQTPERVELAPVDLAEPASEPEPDHDAAPEPDHDAAPEPDPDAAPKPDAAPAPVKASGVRARSWQAQLFVDVAYGVNSNWPDNHVYRGMYTNPRTSELAVNNVGAFIRHGLRDDEPWLFELGIHAGAAVDALTASDPIPGGPDGKFAGSEVFKHIALANVGFALPKTKTVFAAGVFEGPMGIGSFWTYNNANYTTSWESNIVPYYLAGAKVVQPLPAGFEVSAWFINGFQAYADLNPVPSGLVTLTWARGPGPAPTPRTGDTALTLSTQVYFGPESRDLGPEDWLVYWDTWAVWDFDDHFSLAGVWDLAVDRPGREADQKSLYTGGALFLRGTVWEGKHAHVDLALRPEASWDRDGRFFGVDQWLLSGTGTASLSLFDHLMLRCEYRYDYSTADDGFFYRREAGSDDALGLARDQHTVFFALTGWWDFWFGRAEAD